MGPASAASPLRRGPPSCRRRRPLARSPTKRMGRQLSSSPLTEMEAARQTSFSRSGIRFRCSTSRFGWSKTVPHRRRSCRATVPSCPCS